jgi:hypothetical protein
LADSSSAGTITTKPGSEQPSETSVAHDERGEARDHTRFAGRRQTGRDADQVAFGNADVEEPVGMLLAEPFGPGRITHVGINHHDLGVIAKRFKRPSERVASGLAKFAFCLNS